MYLRILKKELQRKKTMNIVLFIFIILAATFVAASVNNMVTVVTALDDFFECAGVPGHWVCFSDKTQEEQCQRFLKEGEYEYRCQEFIQIDPKTVETQKEQFKYSNTTILSRLEDSLKIFDKKDKEITKIRDGEIYIAPRIMELQNLKAGDSIQITYTGKTKSFQVAGSVKDAIFGPAMIGMSRFLISDSDYAFFDTEQALKFYSIYIYTDDTDFKEQLNRLSLNMIFSEGRATMKMMYMVDMVIAAVMLVVSICLILISMVILRFTIYFTMSEEFREIGVMKAVGIPARKIRGLYLVKYVAVAAAGGTVGLLLSIPLGNFMLSELSKNIVLAGQDGMVINLLCVFAVIACVVLFSYSCTRRVNKFSPIDAIRNGESGERYVAKSVLSLGRSKLSVVPFLACNDILSSIKRYVAMLLIFTIGILLVILPINTINTLQSGHLITWFSMAECDHVIGKEALFNASSNNRSVVEAQVDDVREKLFDQGIDADVYEEILFRVRISYQDKQTSSLSFQGVGDITADEYSYLSGSAPVNEHEVGISHIIAEQIGAKIGDTVRIQNGEAEDKYLVTAIYQTMNNMGEGIRFCEKEKLDYRYVFGSFGIQVRYEDEPDSQELERRAQLLRKMFPEDNVYTAGEYIDEMIGGISGQLQGMKRMIILVVLSINILVAVLMVKSFLAKERGEIAILKAIGFWDVSLAAWQTMRIGIILLLSAILAAALSMPLSHLLIGPIFQMMGAQSIVFEIKPLEVYVLYPTLVFGVTVFSGMLAALQLKKIAASEASNME